MRRCFCYHWHIRVQKWTCWKDQLESPWSSPLKLELTSTIFRCTFSVCHSSGCHGLDIFGYSNILAVGWVITLLRLRKRFKIKEEVQVARNQWCQLSLAVHQQYFEHLTSVGTHDFSPGKCSLTITHQQRPVEELKLIGIQFSAAVLHTCNNSYSGDPRSFKSGLRASRISSGGECHVRGGGP